MDHAKLMCVKTRVNSASLWAYTVSLYLPINRLIFKAHVIGVRQHGGPLIITSATYSTGLICLVLLCGFKTKLRTNKNIHVYKNWVNQKLYIARKYEFKCVLLSVCALRLTADQSRVPKVSSDRLKFIHNPMRTC